MRKLSQVLLQFILVAIICWAIPKTGLAYSLSVNPSAIEAGGTITVSWTTPTEESLILDWIGLYEIGGNDYQHIDWQLTGGVSNGNLTFTIDSPGVYEFRYFKHYGYTRRAISDQVTVDTSVDGNYTLTVDTQQVMEGQPITVSWTAPGNADLSLDWIGLYRAGTSNTSWLDYWYTGEELEGSIQATMDSVGIYVFRYLKNNEYTSVVETEEVTVMADPAYTISVDKTTATPGDTVAVSWTAPENADLSLDWIGLYTIGSDDRQHISWEYTNGASSGNLSFVIEDVGIYEFRYFKNDGYELVMVSPRVVMGSFQWPTDFPLGTQGQDYGHYDWGKEDHYHTGLDVAGKEVFATANGIVEKIYLCRYIDCRFDGDTQSDNHVMQNVVILKHTFSSVGAVYSLYAHLGSIDNDLVEGQTITAGSPIGTTGIWCDRCIDKDHPNGRQLNHVHFEIKEEPVLHNPTEGTPCSGALCWGYTPNHPSHFGYHDPVIFLHNVQTYTNAIPIRVTQNDLRIRMGPRGSQNMYPIVALANEGQEFMAIRKQNESTMNCSLGWYQITHTDETFIIAELYGGMVPDGWICADYVE